MTATSLGRFVSGFYPTWDDSEYRRLLGVLELPMEQKVRTFSGGTAPVSSTPTQRSSSAQNASGRR